MYNNDIVSRTMVKTIGRRKGQSACFSPVDTKHTNAATHAVLSTPLPYNLSHADAARDS